MAQGVETTRRPKRDRAAVFALDGDWRFTFLNDRAQELLQHSEQELQGRRIWPWLNEEVRDVYRETLETARKEGEAASAEVHCPEHQRWLRIRAYPQRDGLSVHLRRADGHVERQRELERREEALRHAHEIAADREADPREKVERLLGVLRGTLGTDVGMLSRHDEETDTFELLCVKGKAFEGVREGVRPPPTQTRTCSEVVRSERALMIHDVEQQAPELLGEADLGTYIGAPVVVDGTTFGTFCFFSNERRSEGFDEWEITYVDLLGDWVGAEIERAGGWPDEG